MNSNHYQPSQASVFLASIFLDKNVPKCVESLP